MRILELFSGSATFAAEMRAAGHEVITLDFDKALKPDIVKDILEFTKDDLPPGWIPEIIWASPPCQAFSVANLWNNWDKGKPKSRKAETAIKIVEKTISIIDELKPKYFFIENPRGMLRTLNIMKRFNRRTVTYCQYGLKYQKPTDIWTNCAAWISRKPCKPNMPCHEASPRGSNSGGIQSLNNAYDCGKLPVELCREIRLAIENKNKIKQSTLL